MQSPEFPRELVMAVRGLEELLPLQDDFESTLTRVCEVSVRLLEGCDSASITVQDDGAHTPGASDQVAVDLDMKQYETGEGPCLQAIAEGERILADDLSTETRWPVFVKACLKEGMETVLSIPIRADGIHGGLNLYGRTKGALKERSPDMGDMLAARASIAIENAKLYGASKQLVDQLNEAIKTRELIGEAKGILMAREGVTSEEAFQMLVTVSQNTNTKLRDVAKKLVEETQPER
jgi:GAF domain-containing protein